MVMATGDRCVCEGKYSQVLLKFQGLEITWDFFMLPLGGSDVVLGVDRLEELNTIQWNLKEKFMKFCWKGKEWFIKGLQYREVKMLKAERLNKESR